MIRKSFHIATWLLTLLLFSCVPELGPSVVPQEESPDSEKRVTIRFTVPGYNPETKALGEGGTLNKLYLAVFGSSSYLKEYVEATPHLKTVTDEQGQEQPYYYTYQTTDKDDNPISISVPVYEFEASLALSIDDSPRTVHFLGNGPATLDFGYATSVLPAQLSANGEMAYWQMITLPHGIHARKENVTVMVEGVETQVYTFTDANHQPIPEGATTGYVADEETAACFKNIYTDEGASTPTEHGIPLVRNWAKIVLDAEEGSHFTPVSLAVVNVPTRGSMAPYSDVIKGFITDYQNRSFTELEDVLKYPGTLPAGTTFDPDIPDKEDFEYFLSDAHHDETTLHNGVAGAAHGQVYLYERPAPNDRIPPSYVIIYGYFDGAGEENEAGYYFYKVDLMETKSEVDDNGQWQFQSRYYPIYRNFKYQIIVRAILSAGHSTPEAAAASAGSADVSADINTGHLADISDGIGRLHVMPWMAHTFTNDDYVEEVFDELSVFFSASTNGEPDMSSGENSHVTVELLAPPDGGDDIITNLNIGDPADPDEEGWNGDDKGWRRITFNTVAPGLTMRRQTIRITGYYFNDSEHGGNGRLYRDVEIAIQPIQPMHVNCLERIASERGTEQVLSIEIPDGLLQSMFPLDFIIEAEDMTLTPDNSVPRNNLPVQSGISISDHEGYAGRTAFQYVKTLTWDDYLLLRRIEDEEEMLWREFKCYFKTNQDISRTTIWVANEEYFHKTSTSFTNFNKKYFRNIRFTSPIPRKSDVDVSLAFNMVQDDDGNYPRDYPDVLVSATEMELKSVSGAYVSFEPGPGEGNTYVLHPSTTYSNTDVTLIFKTTTSDGNVSAGLEAYDYEDGYIEPFHFNRYIMMTSDNSTLTPIPDNLQRSYGILDAQNGSNAAYGFVNSGYQIYNNSYSTGKNVYFGYYDDPRSLNATVTLFATEYPSDGSARVNLNTIPNASGMKVISGTGTNNVTFPWTPTGPKSSYGAKNYHEILMNTVTKDSPVFFILSAPGYVEEHFSAERFFGRVHTISQLDNSYLTNSANVSVDTDGSVSFSYYRTDDYGYCHFNIAPVGDAPAVIISPTTNPKGLVLGKNSEGTVVGGTYRVTLTTGGQGNYPQQTLFYTSFNMTTSYNPDLENCSPATGLFFLYPGSNNQYIWLMPKEAPHVQTSTLDLAVAPGGKPACISSITFRSYSSTPKKN